MLKTDDLTRSLIAFEPESTVVAVVEMSQSGWLVAGIVPGVERHLLKKITVDESGLLRLLQRWQDEAMRAGRQIRRITVCVFHAIVGTDFRGSWALISRHHGHPFSAG